MTSLHGLLIPDKLPNTASAKMADPKVVFSSGNCYSFTTVGGINYNALFLSRFPWTKLCLHGHNFPSTSSYEKVGNFPYPTVFSGSYLIIANVRVTAVLTCEQREEDRELYSMVNSCHTEAF